MNTPHTLNIHDRVAVAGRPARITGFDPTPFGGVAISYDDGTTDVVTAEQCDRYQDWTVEADPEIDPTLSPTENYLRILRR